MSTQLRIKILDILNNIKGVVGTRGVSTYEVCRLVNGIKQRSFCHKHRRFVIRKDREHYKGAQDPRGDCSNETQNCCEVSYREVHQALKTLERKHFVKSRRAKALDIKRMPNKVQISRDTYRFWFAVNGGKAWLTSA